MSKKSEVIIEKTIAGHNVQLVHGARLFFRVDGKRVFIPGEPLHRDPQHIESARAFINAYLTSKGILPVPTNQPKEGNMKIHPNNEAIVAVVGTFDEYIASGVLEREEEEARAYYATRSAIGLHEFEPQPMGKECNVCGLKQGESDGPNGARHVVVNLPDPCCARMGAPECTHFEDAVAIVLDMHAHADDDTACYVPCDCHGSAPCPDAKNTVVCHTCGGSGKYVVGPITNGVPAFEGKCFCCAGKGTMTPEDVKRDEAYHAMQEASVFRTDAQLMVGPAHTEALPFITTDDKAGLKQPVKCVKCTKERATGLDFFHDGIDQVKFCLTNGAKAAQITSTKKVSATIPDPKVAKCYVCGQEHASLAEARAAHNS